MSPDELLAISPDLLAKSILHRRERLAEVIPEQLDSRQEELVEALSIASAAKEQRDSINSKISSLKKERNDFQKKATELFKKANLINEEFREAGGIPNPNPKWAREKLEAQLKQIEFDLMTNSGNHKTEEKRLKEMKSLISEHEDWVAKRSENVPKLKEMRDSYTEARKMSELAQKAHEAMLERVAENENFHSLYIEKETSRRRADSRTKKLARALDSSTTGIDAWKQAIAEGFEIDSVTKYDLMSGKRRILAKEKSTPAMNKAAKIQREKESSNQKRGEEE